MKRTNWIRKPPKVRVRLKAKSKKESIGKLKKILWELVKRSIRRLYARPDGTWTCYTCDKHITNPADAHTAHFIASSVCGASLRFSLLNLRICCYKCNVQLGGNGIEFYPRMVKEMGQEHVDQLKWAAHNVLIKADVPWYKEQILYYQGKLGML